jgi:transcriptional regulator
VEAQPGTLRQRIIELIKERPQDAVTLARQLNIRPRGVEGHLTNIQRSVEAAGGHFVVHPSRCTDCGFTFKDRSRTSPPSRCPKCKSEQITLPAFEVRMQ